MLLSPPNEVSCVAGKMPELLLLKLARELGEREATPYGTD